MKANRRQLAIGLGVVAAAQAAAYLLYRKVSGNRAPAGRPFDYETMSGPPRGLVSPLERRDGSQVTLNEGLGTPVLVHFWATWCEPCRTELPELLSLTMPRTLLVSVDENWPVIEHFFNGGPPRHVVRDAQGHAQEAFGVTTLPDSYLLDARGRPLARFHGPRAWSSDEARNVLERLTN